MGDGSLVLFQDYCDIFGHIKTYWETHSSFKSKPTNSDLGKCDGKWIWIGINGKKEDIKERIICFSLSFRWVVTVFAEFLVRK